MKPLRSMLSWPQVRLAGIVILCVVGVATVNHWWPLLSSWVDQSIALGRNQVAESGTRGESHSESHVEDDSHAHGGHDHAHDESSSLELSDQARRNLGLTEAQVRPVQLETFRRTMTVPALVVSRPGRTEIQVSTPMTGVITQIHALPGEAVIPGTLLFQIRLTHEDLVRAQTEYLKILGELDVEEREIARLQKVAASGAIAGKTLLERQYAKDKLDAILKAQSEALRLHGLSDRQIDQIAKERRLLRELQIFSPFPGHLDEERELKLSARGTVPVAFMEESQPAATSPAGPIVLEQLDVHTGQTVSAGERLCVFADYRKLYIEGRAFDQDGRALTETLQREWPIQAIFEDSDSTAAVVDGLRLSFLKNRVDAESRTLSFYVDLPNEIVRDVTNGEGQRYVTWRYRPGQRLQLRVPVEEWKEQIVLPVSAVAKEGAEYFVFQENGNHFDRVPVHVKYRDQSFVVIANDGSLFPGDRIALRSAHQMQMALKNKSGAGADPHAGHNH